MECSTPANGGPPQRIERYDRPHTAMRNGPQFACSGRMAILLFHRAPSYWSIFIIVSFLVMGILAAVSLIISGLRGLLTGRG